VGAREVQLEVSELGATELVDRLRSMAGPADPGFSKFNTLVMIGDGDAFVPAASDRIVREGESVVLIPFSHGG
jgi:hypothetical protein